MLRSFSAALAALTLSLIAAADSAQAKQPNVLIVYADDFGWGETGAQGNKEIPTPHIDSIAQGGVRFTQGYVAATYCSPSRAGLLTGKYPTRFGHEFNGQGPKFGLSLEQKTLADRLKAQGYATAIVGKWHLGDQPDNGPTKRGFDEFYGTLANTPFVKPRLFVDSRISTEVRDVEDPNFYTTDAYAERAVDWLGKVHAKNPEQPFFLYLPFNAQHAPLQAPEKYLARFPEIKDEKRKIFAAMLSAMDDATGRVLGKIKELGREQDTIVWFIGDNGGPTKQTTSGNGPLRGFKATTLEGGTRVPFFAKWPAKFPAGKVYDHPVVNLDVLPTVLAGAGAPVKAEDSIDGVDLLPYVSAKNDARPHETLHWRFGEQWAVRHGDWKLVRSSIDGETPRLFNFAADVGEAKDLAETQPEKAKELTALHKAWDEKQAPPAWKPAQQQRAARRQANQATN